jgi:hypothetical protein
MPGEMDILDSEIRHQTRSTVVPSRKIPNIESSLMSLLTKTQLSFMLPSEYIKLSLTADLLQEVLSLK